MILEVFLLILTVYVLSLIFRPKQNLPPGPWAFPFIGSMPIVKVEKCLEARKKYGDLFMTKTGVARFLYVCDFKLAKELLSKLELADRPQWKCISILEEERKANKMSGIIFSNGAHWLHNRRFLLRHLRDLGMGKSKIEGIMLREIEGLVEDFKSLTKGPSKLPFSINIAVLNIIWQLIASHRFDLADKEVENFMDHITRAQETGMRQAVVDLFPIVTYIIPKPILNYVLRHNTFFESCQKFENLIQPIIDEHVKNLDPNNPCDLMDDYLVEMNEKKSEDYSHFSDTDLLRITFDLFTAGNETTSNMTRWVLLYMAKFPSIQRKNQEEIDKVVPTDILPGLEHRDRLGYLDATINEAQRYSSMISFGVFRSTVSDVSFNGYVIPKGTIVHSVAALSHRDPAYWKNPDDFDPSRFLDANGKYFSTCDGFQAFGLGKRQCLGEQFARMELYLIIAALLQNFTFEPPEGEEINITPNEVPSTNLPRKDQKFIVKYRR